MVDMPSSDRLRRLASELRNREETSRSIALASTRQRSMLPPPPEVPGFEFQAYYQPAANISGDFYDFFWTHENRLGVVVGDVSGHGIETGIVMGRAMATVNIYGRQFDSPREVLKLANTDLYPVLDGRTFISLGYAVLDLESRKFRLANAGGLAPLLFNAGWEKHPPMPIEGRGVVLGADSGERFGQVLQELEVPISPGDLIVFYTDGITEAVNPDNQAKEQYGVERLKEIVAHYGRCTAREVVQVILESLKDFTRRTEYEDDVTLVAFKAQ
jgi:sigma-B regulation protein RsbU (phosphoserine phosphatase)